MSTYSHIVVHSMCDSETTIVLIVFANLQKPPNFNFIQKKLCTSYGRWQPLTKLKLSNELIKVFYHI